MTSQRANKRTRIDPNPVVIEDDISTTQPRSKAPLARAEEHITSTLRSLQPGLAAILLDHGKASLKRLHKLYNKSIQVEKMERDDDFFPRSVRFEFQLHCTKATEQREGYSALQEKVKESLAEMKRAFKAHVVEATKLEQATETDKILEEYCKSIRLIVDAYRIGQTEVCSADKIVAYMLEEHGAELMLPPIPNVDAFKRKYLEIHKISSWPRLGLSTFARAHSSQDSEHEGTREREENSSRLAATIRQSVVSVFPTAWAWYLRQQEDNQVALQLKKLKENQSLTEATERATSDVDMEESVEPEKLLEMVTKSTKKETKQLKQDVHNLTSQLKELKELLKKDGRGSAGPVRQNKRNTNSSTSTKGTQRTQTNQSSKKKSSKPRKNSAGDQNNASRSEKGKGKAKNGRKQSKNKRN